MFCKSLLLPLSDKCTCRCSWACKTVHRMLAGFCFFQNRHFHVRNVQSCYAMLLSPMWLLLEPLRQALALWPAIANLPGLAILWLHIFPLHPTYSMSHLLWAVRTPRETTET